MATKKLMSYDRLIEYDALIKSTMDEKINIAKNELLNGAKADWNQNDETASDYIKNRTHYYEDSFVTYDLYGDILDERETLLTPIEGEAEHFYWCGLYHDEPIEYDKIIGSSLTVSNNTLANGSNTDTITITSDYIIDNRDNNIIIIKYDYDGIAYDRVLIVYDTTVYNGIELSKGIWLVSHTVRLESMSTMDRRNMYQGVNLNVPIKIPHALSEEFIPDTIARVSDVDEKIDNAITNISSVIDAKPKMPIELADFQYFTWGNLSGDTVEEKAQQLARYGVIVYQGELCDNLSMSGADYQRDLELYKKALEYNPDLKVFGYITARGFANSNSGGYVGMTEYRTSPENVDHPIWTKEELAAYINLMAHCGGTKDTSATNEFGNSILTGGIPLYGVFFDDYDYNFEDDNTHLMNQGDWSSIREKHNFLIDYCHSCGLRVMPSSNPNLIFSNDATPNSIRNPDGIPSHMTEDDWFSMESYFLRSDYTFGTSDNLITTYNEKYRDTYKSKCLALTYIFAVSDDAEDNEQIASTFAVYQALCQGADAIALHGTTLFTEIPDEFAKYYDENNNAVYSSGYGYYSLTVNGHYIVASRSVIDTAYGVTPDSKALATCKVTIDGQHTFNNMYVKNEELVYNFTDFKNGVDDKVDELVKKVEQSSNLYHRAFIDDWQKNYTISDYNNYCFTFQNAYGGDDTGATSSWNSLYPYDFTINLPTLGSWRRVEMNARHLAGKTVELGFESCDAYLSGSTSTKIQNVVWQVMGACESNGWLQITTFNANTLRKSVVDGVSRCCTVFTVPEDIQSLVFWTNRDHANPDGAWVINVEGSYLVDVSEHPIQKTWFTNYAPPASTWDSLGSNYKLTYGDESLTVDYTAMTQCYETRMVLPANTTIFKPGETWEIGFKDLKLTQPSTGKDLTSKLVVNCSLSPVYKIYIGNTSYVGFKNMKSEVSDDRFAVAKFTIPDDYAGGLPETPMYIYVNGYNGGDNDGFYQLYVEGLYLYKLDERDELIIRGEDLSNTYIGINRVRTDTIDEELKPDSLYIVDDGSMFITDFRGTRIDIKPSGLVTVDEMNAAIEAAIGAAIGGAY